MRSFQNFVRKWGAPKRLLADSARYQSSNRVLDYLRILWIGLWQSEPHYQHQNKFERRYQSLKRVVNRTMDRTGSPPFLWLLCLIYVSHVFNVVSDPTLNNQQPIFKATGRQGDISSLTAFSWLEPVYFKLDDSSFPSQSLELLGFWAGLADHVGHDMTFLVWHPKTNKILPRSTLRSALTPHLLNEKSNLWEHPGTKSTIDLWLDQQKLHVAPVDPAPILDSSSPPQNHGETLSNEASTTFIYSEEDATNESIYSAGKIGGSLFSSLREGQQLCRHKTCLFNRCSCL